MGEREHVVSVRLTDEEHAYLAQLAEVRGEDRSTVLRDLITSSPLLSIRWLVPQKPECCCELIDVSEGGGPPAYVRGLPRGCTVHPGSWEVSDAEARRRAREA